MLAIARPVWLLWLCARHDALPATPRSSAFDAACRAHRAVPMKAIRVHGPEYLARLRDISRDNYQPHLPCAGRASAPDLQGCARLMTETLPYSNPLFTRIRYEPTEQYAGTLRRT